MSVTLDSTSRSERACARGRRRGRTTGLWVTTAALCGLGGQDQPVRPLILLRGTAADTKQRSLRLVALLNVGQLDLEDLAADAVFQLVASAFRNHATVIDDSDLVRELIRFFEVLGRQQDCRARAAQVAHDLPDLVATPRIETRGGLVEEEHTRLCKHAGCEIKPPPHATRICFRGSVGSVCELEALE